MRTRLIAELATAHGGDVRLAQDMVRAAAEAGADVVKIQSYAKASINPSDPQAAWLMQSHLSRAAHETLMETCRWANVDFLSTPFDAESLRMLRELGQTSFKMASTESGNSWWESQPGERWFVSYPWGAVPPSRPSRHTCQGVPVPHDDRACVRLTAIPLYPTPLEAVGRATLLDGWSDHGDGISACLWAIAQGVKVVEVHVTIPGARSKPWDKSMEQLRHLREFSEACATMTSGIGQTFRDRWKRA